MTETDFRKDQAAVDALNNFLKTPEGLKFLSVLESESVLNKLSSPENQTDRGVRALPLAETGSADNILGRCIGYNLVPSMIKRMRVKFDDATEHKPSRASRVASTMARTENAPENKA